MQAMQKTGICVDKYLTNVLLSLLTQLFNKYSLTYTIRPICD